MGWPECLGLTDTTFPFVLFSRYQDNIYLICANMSPDLMRHTKFALSVMLRVIYGIPLKWEPRGASVTSGEAVITCLHQPQTILLRRKGVCTDLQSTADTEWHR